MLLGWEKQEIISKFWIDSFSECTWRNETKIEG